MSASELEEETDRPTLPDGVAAQHTHLESLIRGVRVRMEAGASWDELASAFDRLLLTVRAHFQAEEALMEQFGYPKLAEHKRMHSTFQRKVEALRLECDRRQTELLGVLVELLQTWFQAHEQTADREALDFLGIES